jgi:hypothetical protein
MYKITFTNAHLGNKVIECDYRVVMGAIPAKGSTLTLDQRHYRVGDAHWDIGFKEFEMGASITVKIELFPAALGI